MHPTLVPTLTRLAGMLSTPTGWSPFSVCRGKSPHSFVFYSQCNKYVQLVRKTWEIRIKNISI